MKSLDQVAVWIVANNRIVILGFILVTLVLALGIPNVTLETSFQEFIGGDTTTEKYDSVSSNFRSGPENTTTTIVMLERGYHVIGYKDMVDQLRYQERIYSDTVVGPTLSEDHPPAGLTYILATVLIQKQNRNAGVIDPFAPDRPSPERMVAAINESSGTDQGAGGTSQDALASTETLAINLLTERVEGPAGGVYAYVPRYYDPKFNQRAHATAIYIYHDDSLSGQELLETQTRMHDIADQEFHDSKHGAVRVYGDGIVNDELNRSTIDSLLLVGPVATLFVVTVLLFAFRDPFDVLIALIGIGFVLIWVFGFMGWMGLNFNQLLISIPIFLMGLSLDYAIHAIMRFREEREIGDHVLPRKTFLGEDIDGRRRTMAAAVGGVGSAFTLVTLSTALGFGSSLTSPSQPIRQFGLIAAFGITAALLVFGALVPAIKIELDELLENRGIRREAKPFGTKSGSLHDGLERCIRVAERAPWVVIMLALVAGTAGLIGASTLDTSFDQKELHVEETPAVLDTLPEPFRPGGYQTKESLEFFRESGFVYENNIAHILVEGDVTNPETLHRVDKARGYAVASNATTVFGKQEVREIDLYTEPITPGTGPVTAMQAVAANNESFNETLAAADVDNDGIPERNVEEVYDEFYATNPDAAETVMYREDGEYKALRVRLATDGTQPTQFIADEMRAASALIESPGVTVTATGRPLIRAAVQHKLFVTILRSFLLTLVVVSIVLMVVYRLTQRSLTLGLVTILPVVFSTAWILGTMAILGIKFNLLTSLITSFTIGLGVDYSIHMTERYVQELERQPSVRATLRATVFGTGGALLGSALTSASGFFVLAFALLKPLQQFGIISGLTIIFAFISSVVVLPSLLVLWTRYLAEDTPTDIEADQFTPIEIPRIIHDSIF